MVVNDTDSHWSVQNGKQVLLRITERCQSWEYTSLLLTFKRQRQVYLCTIEASFVYRVNSRSSRAP